MKKILLTLLVFALFCTKQVFASDLTVGTGKTYETIAAAIAAAADGDRILIDDGTYTVTAALNPGDKSLSFIGTSKAGTIIQSNTDGSIANAWPVFNNSTAITANRTYNFSNLTIKNGYLSGNGGGLVFSTGTSFTLTLNFTDVNITGNQTTGNSNSGGAFYLAGNMNSTFTNCYFYDNKTKYNGGGGAIYIASGANTLNINNCYFLSNQTGAKGGGAICSASTGAVNITIKNSTFKSNLSGLGTGSNKGGAICLTPGAGATSLWVENSTFNLNTAGYLANTTQAGLGGAIFYQSGASTTNSITLNHCTITGNVAKTNPGVTGGGDGVCIADASTNAVKLTINNSIIIGNTGSSINTSDVGTNAASQAKISTVGAGASSVTNSILVVYNNSWGVTNGETTSNYNFNNKTDAVVADLAFGTITTDATPVLPIGVTSIARNYLVTEKLSPALSTDQIGQTRMFKPDAGAYESQSPVYQVSLTAAANGSVSVPTGGWGGGYFDDANTGLASKYSATVTATPDPTYEFDKWTDGVGTTVSTDNPYIFNVTANTSLTANFKISAVPVISVTPATLTGFGYAPGSGPSSEKSFNVSGINLTNDITITPPANYEISTASGTSFVATNPIIIDNGSGTVSSTPIYIRLVAGKSAATAFNGENVTLESTGATTQNVSCSGNVYAAAPSTAATTAIASDVLHTTATLNWTAGDADKYLVVFSANSDVATAHLPVGGTTYTAGQTLASGYTVGYAGTGTSASLTGLPAGTTVYFAVFGYNDKYSDVSTAGYENYLTSSPATTSAITIVPSNATDYFRSRVSGTWATASVWESSANGSSNWHLASSAPTSSATSVSIQDGYTVTVDAPITIPATTVDATSTLKATAAITAGSTLVVTGTYEHAVIPAAIQTAITSPVTTWNSGSTLLVSTQYPSTLGGTPIAANNQVQSFGGSGYQNVTFNVNIPVADAFIAMTAIINAKLKVIATGIGGLVTTGSEVSAGSYEQIGGIVIGNRNSDSPRGITVLGDATISGGALNVRYNFNNTKLTGVANFKVGGNLTITGGSISNGVSGSNSPSSTLPIIEFTKSGTQTYTNSGVAFTNGVAILVDGTSTLDMGTSTFAGAGTQSSTFTTSSGTTLLIGNSNGIDAYFGANITPTFNAGTNFIYNGSSAQLSGSLPASANTIEINNTNGVSLGTSVSMNNLTIGSGSSLTVAAGKQVTVSSSLTNNGTIVLGSGSDGSATLLSPGTITGSGTATVQQYLTSGRNWYVSSPVTTAGYGSLSTATSIQYWDEPTALWKPLSTGNLLVGKGYISATTTTNGNIEYNGTLNNGDVTINLTRTKDAYKLGFNLIGNPYPSYLNWKAVYDDLSNVSANVDPTIWYRTKNSTGAYKFGTYGAVSNLGTNIEDVEPADVVTGNIPPMQAFWVRVNASGDGNSTTGSINLKNSMRAHKGTQLQADANTYNDSKLRSGSVNSVAQQVLRLKVSNGTNTDETILLFNENASDGLDAYDSQKMSNGSDEIPEIYTSVGTQNLAINGLNTVQYEKEYPLGFFTRATGTFSINLSQAVGLPSDVKLFLVDHLLNSKEFEFGQGVAYSFTSVPTTSNSRFGLIFRNNQIPTGSMDSKLNKIDVMVNNAAIMVHSNDQEMELEIFNSLGVLVARSGRLTTAYRSNNLRSGVYLLKVKLNESQQFLKVIVP